MGPLKKILNALKDAKKTMQWSYYLEFFFLFYTITFLTLQVLLLYVSICVCIIVHLHTFCVCVCVSPHQSKDQTQNKTTVIKPRVNDGLKMRASVRMTRYLESWGAVKPFAHLQSREGFATDTMVNGKARNKVHGDKVLACWNCPSTRYSGVYAN